MFRIVVELSFLQLTHLDMVFTRYDRGVYIYIYIYMVDRELLTRNLFGVTQPETGSTHNMT